MYFNVPKAGRRKSTEYRNWELSVIPYLALTLNKFEGKVVISYTFNIGTSFRGDLSNRIKAVEDALVKSNRIIDDNWKVVVGYNVNHQKVDGKKSTLTISIENFSEQKDEQR